MFATLVVRISNWCVAIYFEGGWSSQGKHPAYCTWAKYRVVWPARSSNTSEPTSPGCSVRVTNHPVLSVSRLGPSPIAIHEARTNIILRPLPCAYQTPLNIQVCLLSPRRATISAACIPHFLAFFINEMAVWRRLGLMSDVLFCQSRLSNSRTSERSTCHDSSFIRRTRLGACVYRIF